MHLPYKAQRAKKVVSDSPGLVDFAIQGSKFKKNVWSQICDLLRKFGRNFENVSREINWGHLIKK